MTFLTRYSASQPPRAEVDALPGPTVLEFGTWCGYCMSAQPVLARAFEAHPAVRHLKVEDGKGLPLGRSFGVRLWPTLVFLQDGQEVARLVRPGDAAEVQRALARIDAPADPPANDSVTTP
jgi:thioredoxin 1